jgi:RND superfamily putative drug exporter
LTTVPERWTRAVLRHQLLVVACWIAVLAVGVVASTRLPGLLSNSFGVPGTQSEQARAVLERSFGERPDGTFTVVFRVARPSDRATQRALERRLQRAAATIPGAVVRPLRTGPGIVYADIATTLPIQEAKHRTAGVRRALVDPGAPAAAVTGAPALQHDLDPIVSADLRRAELIAVPITLAVLVALLGVSVAVLIPFLFAACTIAGALALVYALARATAMATYVTNLVVLVGLALAIDYSLLVVNRYREELGRGGSREDAVARTMATAGRAITFSGLAVAAGLGALLFVPVPFIRSLGVGGLLVPLVSLAAVCTLQPVMLARLGRVAHAGPPPPSPAWLRLAGLVTGSPRAFLAGGFAILLAAAAAATTLGVTPGSISSIPGGSESVRGFELLRDRVGVGVAAPVQIVVDGGSPGAGRTGDARAAVVRLVGELGRDPDVLIVANGVRDPYVDRSGRYARVIVAARHDYGATETRRLVGRIRDELVPAARFPAGASVDVGGAPAQGVDFMARAYGAFPWLVLAVLAVTLVLLVRAFRSLVLALQATVLDLLSVAATYGMLALVVEHGVGAGLLGIEPADAVEAWVPIALFALLFGLSMDYEVFIVMPMREAWDAGAGISDAVAQGLVRTGRIVTAAAAIMVVVFSGFVAGRVPGLQQFGLGLALGVLVDATVVRLVVVPALVRLGGRRSFWLPAGAARLVRVAPSPLRDGDDAEAAPLGAASGERDEGSVTRRR